MSDKDGKIVSAEGLKKAALNVLGNPVYAAVDIARKTDDALENGGHKDRTGDVLTKSALVGATGVLGATVLGSIALPVTLAGTAIASLVGLAGMRMQREDAGRE